MLTRAHAALTVVALMALRSAALTEDRDPRLDWFNQARFGMFIHWGVYSVPAGEWKGKTNYAEWIMLQGKIPSAEYEKFAKQFNPVGFDAREWAQLAKDAGMRYMVITSKHHDGFCMYDSRLTDYDIVDATPFHRDPMKELSAACRAAGLRFCFYYSVVDWHHPEFPARYAQHGFHGDPNPKADLEKYVDYMQGQVRELLTNYGPIGILWFDGGGSFRGVKNRAELIHAQETIDLIHRLQPACLVNNRLGLPADYGTPEQHIPGRPPKTAFEVCMTLNRHWGYNKNDHDWKEAPVIIANLVDIASKGGNYLLNVGPTAEGKIPPDSVRILRQVGKWMKRNGESIYGTTASPFDYTPEWGRVTAKDNRLYLHVLKWPTDRRLVLQRLVTRPGGAWLLADTSRRPLAVRADGEDVLVTLPAKPAHATDTVVVLELEGPPTVVAKSIPQAPDGSILLRAADAVVHGSRAYYEKDETAGKDNIGAWYDPAEWVSWDVKVHRPGNFDVYITYACPQSTSGTTFDVAIGTMELPSRVKATGSWVKFKEHYVGCLRIDGQGRHSLSVRPTAKPSVAVMNLQSVRLAPVE